MNSWKMNTTGIEHCKWKELSKVERNWGYGFKHPPKYVTAVSELWSLVEKGAASNKWAKSMDLMNLPHRSKSQLVITFVSFCQVPIKKWVFFNKNSKYFRETSVFSRALRSSICVSQRLEMLEKAPLSERKYFPRPFAPYVALSWNRKNLLTATFLSFTSEFR